MDPSGLLAQLEGKTGPPPVNTHAYKTPSHWSVWASFLRDLDAATRPAAQSATSELSVQQLTIIFC